MPKIQITHSVELPDQVRLARYKKAPELGPRILFFTGGTALRSLSQELVYSTHNSVHIITPFDSGGSSATIRNAFKMLAVGDLRNRLMALADRSVKGNPAIFDLFAYRLPKDITSQELAMRLDKMIDGKDKLIARVPDPMRKLIRSHLRFFSEQMPDDFDLRGASIGNLILAGGFFNYQRHIDPVIYLFTKLVEVRGVVRPVISRDLHLAVEMEDGSIIVGQHNITGKETAPITQRIKNMYLTGSLDSLEPVDARIRPKVDSLIRNSELICYPLGSFYSSVIANLLPKGVGTAVWETNCPKVYVPNSCPDPEMYGMTLSDCVKTLIDYLQRSCGQEVPTDRLLNFVLIDSKRGDYPTPLEINKIKRFGVEVLDVQLISEESAPYLDEKLLADHLLSLT